MAGDNIISARGDDWRLYRSIIKPGLQGTFEIEPIVENATRLCALLADAQRSVGKENGGVSVQEYIQSYTTANVSRTLLKTEIEVFPTPTPTPMHALSDVDELS